LLLYFERKYLKFINQYLHWNKKIKNFFLLANDKNNFSTYAKLHEITNLIVCLK